jgi:hypothetical protein
LKNRGRRRRQTWVVGDGGYFWRESAAGGLFSNFNFQWIFPIPCFPYSAFLIIRKIRQKSNKNLGSLIYRASINKKGRANRTEKILKFCFYATFLSKISNIS